MARRARVSQQVQAQIARRMHVALQRAPIAASTKQPVKGRSANGGLSIGEMERSALIANGLGSFIKETFMERSDKATFVLNKTTGNLGFDKKVLISSGEKQIKLSHPDTTIGDDDKNFGIVQVPYAWKLFTQEMEALGISTSMITNDEDIEIIEDLGEDIDPSKDSDEEKEKDEE